MGLLANSKAPAVTSLVSSLQCSQCPRAITAPHHLLLTLGFRQQFRFSNLYLGFSSDPTIQGNWKWMLAILNSFRIAGHRKSNLPRIIAQWRRKPEGFKQPLPRPE